MVRLTGSQAGLTPPFRPTQDFHSCTINCVNCPGSFTIFPQLLDNFLLLGRFTAFLFMFYLQPGLSRFRQQGVFFFLIFHSLFFTTSFVLHRGCQELFRWRRSRLKRLRIPRVSRNNKPGSGVSFILISGRNYERQSSLIKMGDEIIVICLIISVLTGEFIF